MNTSANNYDTIERLIYEENLHIEAVDFHPELDIMLILLNTKAVFTKDYLLIQNWLLQIKLNWPGTS
jgi:hypothetical protein